MKEIFAIRFTLNNAYIERKSSCKILALWINEDSSDCDRNTKEIKGQLRDAKRMNLRKIFV